MLPRQNVGNVIFVDAIKQFAIHVSQRPEAAYGALKDDGDFVQGLENARIQRQNTRRNTRKLKRSPSSASTSSLESDSNRKIHELVRSRLKLQETLGQGQYGLVRRAEYVDTRASVTLLCALTDFLGCCRYTDDTGATVAVAAKVLKIKIGKEAQNELIHEAIITSAISHENVVGFIGAVLKSQPHMLVLEYCSKGSLLAMLKSTDLTKYVPSSFTTEESGLASSVL